MKKLLIITSLMMLISSQILAQECVKVDSVYSTAKLRELGNKDIRFGIKQIAEDVLSEKYCLSEKGDVIDIEVYYFGIPKKSLRIAGVEKTNQITQVGVRLYYKNLQYEGLGESDTEVRAVMIELVDGQVPFSKMTVSNALKKAIIDAINKIPQ
jgi:hypothetical protein